MLKKSKNKWNLDYSFLEKKGYKDFASRLNLNSEKSAKAFKVFFNNLRKEARETKQASYLVVKFLKEGKLSKKEEKELKHQFYDVLKIMGVGIPFFMIPGATVLVPFLIKLSRKLGLDIIPTSFKKDEDL
ncbi:MAG: hypothetical protein ISQ99_01055 [Flavobacteriales bacterium]|nr:hypothetical protein [Flavobacteriales bacterium]MBL6868624.1 hypothetical protein [Flavobacteriales bacterium]